MPPHPDCVGLDRQHIPGELDSHLKQQSLVPPSLPPFLPAALVSSPFASAGCITRLPSGLGGSDPLITPSAHTGPHARAKKKKMSVHITYTLTHTDAVVAMPTCTVAKEAPWCRACIGFVARLLRLV